RFLVAVGAEVERVVVVRLALRVFQVRRAEGAGVVAAAGAFDLDHLGAEIGQHLRRQGTSKHPCQVENFDARKWQSRHELPPNFWRGGAGTWLVALRSQADTLFYVIEPCITGMTLSVRRPICTQAVRQAEGLGVAKGGGYGIPGKGNSRCIPKQDGPPKRAVYRQTVLPAGLITCWCWPWRGWRAIPGIRDTADRGPAGQGLWPVQQPAQQQPVPTARRLMPRPRPGAAACCGRAIPAPP